MRLSEAIRLGAMLKPQKFTCPNHQLKHETHTCALAAASEAAGQEHLSVYAPHWLWPWATEVATNARQCPACGDEWLRESMLVPITVVNTITHLNDRHRWTREAIAAFVATVEPAERCDAVPEASCARELHT